MICVAVLSQELRNSIGNLAYPVTKYSRQVEYLVGVTRLVGLLW